MSRGFTEKLADLIWDELDQQTDTRLLKIVTECESLTSSNCGWVAYGLKDIVARIVKNILHDRQEAT